MMKQIVWLCFWLNPLSLWAQILTGRVLEADTDRPLYAASVLAEDGKIGTRTNLDGKFSLGPVSFPLELSVRYLGYEPFQIRLTRLPNRPLVIRLRPTSIDLDGVEVSGEDPALPIMRKVIAQKNQFYSQWASFSANMLTRFVLRANNRIVQIKETDADVFRRTPFGLVELIRGKRHIPNTEEQFRFADREPLLNFYDDTILLQGRLVSGPTHPDAIAQYAFRLGPTQEDGGDKVAQIYFSPRNGQMGLSGNMQVDLARYVITEITVRPSSWIPDTVVRDFEATYQQTFATWTNGIQVPVSLDIEGKVFMGRTGVTYPLIKFKQINRLQSIRVNASVPDSLFRKGEISMTEPGAELRPQLIQRILDVLPHSAEEYKFVSRGDTRLNLKDEIKPDGFLAQYLGEEVVTYPMSAGQQVLKSAERVLKMVGLGIPKASDFMHPKAKSGAWLIEWAKSNSGSNVDMKIWDWQTYKLAPDQQFRAIKPKLGLSGRAHPQRPLLRDQVVLGWEPLNDVCAVHALLKSGFERWNAEQAERKQISTQIVTNQTPLITRTASRISTPDFRPNTSTYQARNAYLTWLKTDPCAQTKR